MTLISGALWMTPVAAQAPTAQEPQTAQQQPSPRCFGAAARDPKNPCANRALTRTVRPDRLKALREPNSDCKVGQRSG